MLSKSCLLFALVLIYFLNSVPLVQAQDDDPPGFLSIDCGLPQGSDYEETYTGLHYKSDANLIDSGESKSLLPSLIGTSYEKYLSNVRSFPKGNKNCYTIQPSPGKGHKYLIRATFMYGNYDSLNQFPTFDLNLGPDTWSTITIEANLSVERKEIIHVLSSDYIHVCLVNTGTGTPFISALELRPLSRTNTMYSIASGSLQTLIHADCDSKITNTDTRYKADIYDRTWYHFNVSTNKEVNTSLDINNANDYRVPANVLRTASIPENATDPLQFEWTTKNTSDEFYMYMHFAEVEQLQANQYREFNIYVNGKRWNKQLVVPDYLSATYYYPLNPLTGNTEYVVTLNKTASSTLPPILNALEIYSGIVFSKSGTNETDVAAILNIKSTYKVSRDWQGDPCEPGDFLWDGLKCNYDTADSARIISLNLSRSGLTGEIIPSIANLTELKTLDLSHNNLSGQVPEFLSQLALSVLNLTGNNFTGPIPAQLLEKERKGILSLSFDGQEEGNGTSSKKCEQEPCKKKGQKSSSAIVGAVVGSALLLAAILFGIWILSRRASRVRKLRNQTQVNNGDIEKKNRQYSYSEVLNITRNFQKVLGKGGFGTVYHGYVGDLEVAVKMLSPSSTQGYKEFQAEASLLLNVHHKNLTALVGYCNEGTNMGIIYEYMANRSLDKHLKDAGNSFGILSWQFRLQIALDAAQGLEYLHHGCKPAIIHRDVKTSNILLNEQFQAKLADFGLSRAYSAEGATHVSTVVAGTPGYLDPDYYISNRLTEKSDVFSFGVVLLEMITGRPAILTEDRTHIAQWVASVVQNGDVRQVIDPRFRGKYDVNSVWKAVELAMTCASRISSTRPTMSTVVTELKECLAVENGSHDAADSYSSNGMVSITDMESALAPRAR